MSQSGESLQCRDKDVAKFCEWLTEYDLFLSNPYFTPDVIGEPLTNRNLTKGRWRESTFSQPSNMIYLAEVYDRKH
jgi:hypothetical protein